MTITTRILHRFILIIALLLAACGGGGGTPSTPLPATVNVAAAWNQLLTTNATWTTTAVASDGSNLTFTVQVAAGATGAFPVTGQTGATSRQTSSVSLNGTSLGVSANTLYFNGNDLFGVAHGDGSCSVVPTLASPIPGASVIGSTGSFATSYDYDTCNQQPTVITQTSNDWTLEVDSGVALFCIASRSVSDAGATLSQEQDCLEVAADGTLGSRARFTVYLPNGTAIIARNF